MRKEILCLLAILMLVTVLVPVNADKEICAYYFYREGCANCAQVEPVVEKLLEKYTNFNVTKLDVDVSENYKMLRNFMKAYGIESDSQPLPIVVIDNQFFAGVEPVKDNLEDIIKDHKEGLDCSVAEEQDAKLPSIPVVIGAAIADAVNPCALAFLLLLLITIAGAAYTGRSKKVLYCGLVFAISVYIAHLIMGLGLLKVIQFAGVTTYIKIGVGILAVIVGLFNLKDFLRLGAFGFKTEVPEKWKLKVKMLINKVASVPGAFLVGLLVSLFLTPCTFGPYIAIIGALASSATFWQSLPLLLLYNLVFILPMVALTIIIYLGADARRIQNWRTANTRWLHLVAGLIILTLGILMLIGVI